MLCQRGISAAVKSIVSRTSRIDWRGGNTNSFWAWYSLRMSFWSVPPRRARGMPACLCLGDEHREDHGRRRVDRHRRGDLAEVDPAIEILHVGDRVDRHAAAPDLAERHRIVAVEAEQGGHVECRRQSGTAGLDDLLEAPVGVVGGAEPGEHPHRPQPRAVHRGVGATRVRELAGELAVVRAVDRLERDPRHRLEVGVAQVRGVERLLPQLSVAGLMGRHEWQITLMSK